MKNFLNFVHVLNNVEILTLTIIKSKWYQLVFIFLYSSKIQIVYFTKHQVFKF